MSNVLAIRKDKTLRKFYFNKFYQRLIYFTVGTVLYWPTNLSRNVLAVIEITILEKWSSV